MVVDFPSYSRAGAAQGRRRGMSNVGVSNESDKAVGAVQMSRTEGLETTADSAMGEYVPAPGDPGRAVIGGAR